MTQVHSSHGNILFCQKVSDYSNYTLMPVPLYCGPGKRKTSDSPMFSAFCVFEEIDISRIFRV